MQTSQTFSKPNIYAKIKGSILQMIGCFILKLNKLTLLEAEINQLYLYWKDSTLFKLETTTGITFFCFFF